MMLPTFIIAGAQKAGTTSLYSMLSQHPDVFMSDPKEPGFFVRGFDDPERWQTLKRPGKGGNPGSLASVRQGIFTLEEYSRLFESDNARRARHRGEASTPYLPSPYAARRIAQTCPGVRIILSLRDPVMRAYSAWGYNYSRGIEVNDTFEEAIEHELSGNREDWMWGWRYLYSGCYFNHVERFLKEFPRDRVLIFKFEDFRRDPTATFARVCSFLDIPPCEITNGVRANRTTHHRNPVIARLRSVFTRPGSMKAFGAALPRPFRDRFRKRVVSIIDRFGDRPPPLADRTSEFLAAYFAEDTAALEELVGLDLSEWRSASRTNELSKEGV